MQLADLPYIPARMHLTGTARSDFERQVAEVYRSDPSVTIRAIAAQTGRSYGNIHRALTTGGVRIRSRNDRKRTRADKP